jgi:hypothetical protein
MFYADLRQALVLNKIKSIVCASLIVTPGHSRPRWHGLMLTFPTTETKAGISKKKKKLKQVNVIPLRISQRVSDTVFQSTGRWHPLPPWARKSGCAWSGSFPCTSARHSLTTGWPVLALFLTISARNAMHWFCKSSSYCERISPSFSTVYRSRFSGARSDGEVHHWYNGSIWSKDLLE